MVIVYSRYDASEIIFRRDDINTLNGANLMYANMGCADLSGADLRHADLRDAHLRRANLIGADLRGADLRGADLRHADLRHADLRHADFRRADLNNTDLRGAGLPDGIPILDRPYTQILDQIRGDGELEMDAWHKCKTTHCLAGWLIHLCGEKRYELEEKLKPTAAGALIHARSCPNDKVPNFHASNEDGMAYIVSRANEESAKSTS